ncbi:MAG: glutamate--tRNA ligase [Campylobacteraceae bacterium 4484_4]|nr:MAG: glutamate--tRNA ligase [Campylobacteraceae bacterium 4484_4]
MYRFAPSPTGDMHIGNLRVALFNFIMAKKEQERFIIRIEDTDKERNITGKDMEILQLLEIFGITYDEVFYQSENLSFHQKFAMKLLMEKRAFACFCTEEELERKREMARAQKRAYRYDGSCLNLTDEEVLNNEKPFVVRIKKPEAEIRFVDAIKGEVCFLPENVDDFVILRHDKSPTYNFACAVDDMLHNIGFVIRGEDHLSNTPKQIHIRRQLGYTQQIRYAHLPIILNEAGKKMSKRDNASSVKWLLEEGFLPQAIANYLILIGNQTPSEIFTIEEAVEWFDLSRLSKSPAKFDLTKLRQINRAHINRLDPMELAKLIGYSSHDIGALAKLYTEEASTINEIKEKIDRIFSTKVCEAFPEEFETLKEIAKRLPYAEDYESFKNALSQQSGLKGKRLFKPLRVLLTGAESGPNLSDLYPHIKHYLGEIIK